MRQSNPVSYGYDFQVIVEYGYHSGGGSYVLSKTAMKRIGEKLDESYKFCPNTGTEDVDVAKCLRMLNVYPERSFDELGRERFHPLSMWDHFEGNFPDWMYSYSRNPVKKVNFLY
jgi:glycoprotein-N-acetylgalactosamine 3-beta-galactosyltransferase